MELKYIYKSNIERDINGVIKVAQDDIKSMEQELSEYIITKELRKHFTTFFSNYERSLTEPTDKIGVWISGFFGSGKSHFLKILSYLLSNKKVNGKGTIEYFSDKFDDPMMYAQVEACTKVPTDTILFNIDSKSPINKDKTAILRVFAKVFYEHCGFYGNDLKVARLEQFVSKSGKKESFEEKFEEINGATWEESRDALTFFEDDIVECLQTVLGMSETAARNWFNSSESTELSIEQLVGEIKDYVYSKGKDYRLLFMIDEVGQYIGSDSDLMLNLQTIVEEIGTKCEGRVWVVVTSQEAIDSITKISGNDFSKIQGRFNTRLSLSSSSVDEVIKKRILAKNANGESLLKLSYEKNYAVFKNLFSFTDSALDLKGYSGEEEYIETYPFVPYQFRLVQNVLAQIRKHGNSGKHLSGGERSMLSGFQEAAQTIKDKDEKALVPFCLFYNTVHTFLESTIRRVIDRCQKAADDNENPGIFPYDVEVLKLLYLIRYIDDVKANVDNITTLMIDNIDADKIKMRQEIQRSLDRLMSQNYISRNGDTYTFLTDDEQDIAREIANTSIDSASITQSIAQMIFGDIYAFKKFRYGKYDFAFDQIVDETNIGVPTGGIKLRIVTVASDLYNSGEQTLLMRSSNNEVIIKLSDKTPYFEELQSSMKIRKYVKGRNVTQLPEVIQRIIRERQQQASAYEKQAKTYIEQAIINADFYIDGEIMVIKAGGAKDKIETALESLVDGVYSKLRYITDYVENDNDIRKILTRTNEQLTIGDSISPNSEAVAELEQYLQLQNTRNLPTSMGDILRRYKGIPYGWREIDIVALVATLIARQKITVSYSGNVIQPLDSKLIDYLRRASEVDKVTVSLRTVISPLVIKKAREFLKEYFGEMDIPTDEDRLIDYIVTEFTAQTSDFSEKLDKYYLSEKYPDKQLLETGIKLCRELLMERKDNRTLLDKMISMQDDFLDHSEDISDLNAFFKNQKQVFDKAYDLVEKLVSERDYIETSNVAITSYDAITEILRLKKPYRRISELPELCQKLENEYAELTKEKKEEVNSLIRDSESEIKKLRTEENAKILEKAELAFADKERMVANATSLTQLDAMKIQIENQKKQYFKAMLETTGAESEVAKKSVTLYRSNVFGVATLKTEADIENYLSEVKNTLIKSLEGNDTVHII